ncbi:hypothetical protein D3C87_2011140 [compost metagenome]
MISGNRRRISFSGICCIIARLRMFCTPEASGSRPMLIEIIELTRPLTTMLPLLGS